MAVCAHGALARSCDRCEDAATIQALRAALAVAAEALATTDGNIRSLGPAGALGPIYETYVPWLRVVAEAHARAVSVLDDTRELNHQAPNREDR